MAEQKKKETRPTKPAEGDESAREAASSPRRARSSRKISTISWTRSTTSSKENAEEFVKSYVPARGRVAVPIFEYTCLSCEREFEKLVNGGAAVACPDSAGPSG